MKQSIRREVMIAMMVVIAVVCAACGGGRSDDTTSDASEGLDKEAAKLLHLDACEGYQAAPGVTDDEIVLGTSYPMSGPFAAQVTMMKAMEGFFAYANAELGGVDGRKVRNIILDDGYDPARTAANVQKLLQQDRVFALLSVAGSPTVASFYKQTDAECVPNLYVGTNASQFGDQANYPWTLPGSAASATQAAILAEWLAQNTDAKTIAMLRMNDDNGKAQHDALTKAAEERGLEVVAVDTTQQTDPNVTSQITSLAASKADVFYAAMAGPKCAQALNAIRKTSWRPVLVGVVDCSGTPIMELMDAGAAEDFVSLTYIKDPSGGAWTGDEAVDLYREKLRKYAPDARVDDLLSAIGWTQGALMYETLTATPELTRASLMYTAQTMDIEAPGLFLPGMRIKTGVGDGYPIESLQVVRYDQADRVFRPIAGVDELPEGEFEMTSVEGQTSKYFNPTS